jgi:flagellar basal-body rod modification protein FlgD
MSSITAFPSISGGASSGASGSSNAVASQNAEAGERFLKLLITQLQNQDPMNPMDNAQLTTQMAQINTVAGIEKLNDSVKDMSGKLAGLDTNAGLGKLQETLQGLSGQMLQSQTLQGAALVGRQVWLEADTLAVHEGTAQAAFELAGPSDAVSVEVLSPSGRVLAKLDLGTQAGGRVPFQWSPPEGTDTKGLRYRVSATSGTAPVKATPFTLDRVDAVATGADGLMLQLSRNGLTQLSRVKSLS